jgi:hypothetical protein
LIHWTRLLAAFVAGWFAPFIALLILAINGDADDDRIEINTPEV